MWKPLLFCPFKGLIVTQGPTTFSEESSAHEFTVSINEFEHISEITETLKKDVKYVQSRK